MAVSCICAVPESGSHRDLPQRGAPRQVGWGPSARQGSTPVLQAPALLPSLSSNLSSLLTCRGPGSSRAGRGMGAFLEEGTLDRVGHEDSFSGDRESRAEQMGCHGEGRPWALGGCRGWRAEVTGRRSSSRDWASFHVLSEEGGGLEAPLDVAMLSTYGP
ncbi:unnamed protein product [Rangifer tarandus platyrhynchus]|uniref:Uncharacterized protein n=2 Tax=Rangifer tarandus platyrhynchus TaxID=3082113 RepID=A0ABN8Y9M2_RANTA|nr:unnamed protein product [Rangifer tarandus platyrhynchus]